MDEYPVRVQIDYPQKSSRILALIGIPFLILKLIILLPHIVILYFLGIFSFIVAWFSYWVVLFTGKYPQGLFNFVVGVIRWQTRMNSWLFSLTDKYPPFSLN